MQEKVINEEELELNEVQVARNDEIYNAVFEVCKVMTENPSLEYDINFIGEIAEYAALTLTRHKKRVHFPSIVTNPDSTQYIEEFYNEDTFSKQIRVYMRR